MTSRTNRDPIAASHVLRAAAILHISAEELKTIIQPLLDVGASPDTPVIVERDGAWYDETAREYARGIGNNAFIKALEYCNGQE